VYQGKLYVPNLREMKNIVLREMKNVPYAGIQGSEIYCNCKKPILLAMNEEISG
jgi:hypothetical protein